MKHNGLGSLLIYFVLSVALFLYSFTQIDLGLTLIRYPVYHSVELFFKQIGYFNRLLSTEIFVVLTFFLFLSYLFCLRQVRKGSISQKQAWFFIIAITVLLTFSYNAFSYDIFNYIFDAKIVTHYNQNPYQYKALDFPADPMLSFMRWTHRVYPYGPFWLVLTVPLSFLGFNLFLPTFFLFKILMAAGFLGTIFYIQKIMKVVNPKNALLAVTFFALNPLVLIESLVSAHNDVVMMFFAVLAVYFIIEKKYFSSFFAFIVSVGIKFATLSLLPILGYIIYRVKKKGSPHWDTLFVQATILMIIPVILASVRTNFQPWYLLYLAPFASLVGQKPYILIPSVILSLFALLQYAPFLYLGNWDLPVPQIIFWLGVVSVVLSVVVTVGFMRKLQFRAT